MTPSRMPDYRLPNKRGIVGQAAALLHRIGTNAANSSPGRQTGRAHAPGVPTASPARSPAPVRAASSLGWLMAVVAGLSTLMVSTPAAVASGKHPLPAGLACAAAQQPAAAGTSTLMQLAADSLAGLIVHLRDTALHEGTEPVPRSIRAQLNGFVPDEILDLVRWRTDDGDGLSRSGILSAMGLVAVTVDHVVLFTDPEMARGNPGIWAHELRHVMQYRDCGVDGFALAYLTDHDELEADARRYSLAWHQWTLDHWLEQVIASGADLTD